MTYDFAGGPIYFLKESERGDYLHTWLDIVRMSVANNSPIVIKNFKFN